MTRKENKALYERLSAMSTIDALHYIVEQFPDTYPRIILNRKESVSKAMRDFINARTPLLQEPFYRWSTKLYWVFNDIHEFPRCSMCNRPFININVKALVGYHDICQKCNNRKDSPRTKKARQTNIKRYGSSCYLASDEGKEITRQMNLLHGGREHNWQREDVKQHIRETNLKRYGVENPSQNPEIRRKAQARYVYHGIQIDSSWELAFYIWLEDHHVDFQYQPASSFTYEYNGKIYSYCPDFLIGDHYIEFKGNQFFEDKDPAKKMVNPYDSTQNDRYEAKHQCMLQNGVEIKVYEHTIIYIKYVENKYGKDYLHSFKRTY